MKAIKMHENRNNNMESFYEENGQYVATTTQARAMRNMKRPESLDLNLAINNNKPADKKARCTQIPASILASPDVNKLIWGTPDLEKFLMQMPTPVFAPNAAKEVTNEQEEYAQPFVDALNNLRNNEKAQHPIQHNNVSVSEFATVGTTGAIVMNPAITTTSATTSTVLSKAGMSGGSLIYTNLDENTYPVTIKDEPQTVPNSPPMSPIDMESQEKIKLERKRQRNRVAASKCRKRKLERISKLEDKVKLLKGENIELSGVIKSLKEHVMVLKQKVIEHINNGCSIPTYSNTAYFVRPSKVTDSDIK